MTREEFQRLCRERIVFLDGATGTNLQKAGMPTGVCPEAWILEHPDTMMQLQKAYFEAGSDIVLSNTFGANAIKFHDSKYGLKEIVTAGIQNAKKAAERGVHDGRKTYVALDVGPTGKLLKPMGDLSFEDAYDAFKETMIYGEQAGADLIHIETMSDTYEVKAAILAAKESRAYIQQADIQKAFIKVGIGAEKHSRVISEKEKKITAYHESGHALLFHLLPDVGPVHTVSIIPTGAGAAGYTMPLPEKDEMFNSRGRMLQEIVVDLGGRVAEELVFDDITTGASQDIKQATKMARDMVTRYGMSENIGLICYKDDDDEVFIGRDLAHAHSYSEGIASAIDVEVKRIIDESYEKAKTIIAEHRDVLDRCAALLLEKEKITREEFEALFEA